MIRSPDPRTISAVRPGSLASEAGLEPGDTLLSVAGHCPRDVVDLQFYQADPEVEVVVRRRDGRKESILFEKDIDEDLGFEFDRPTWDDVTLCNNNCFFCFLKGLPRGMRRTLYLKDDDYRLSFLHGNFVTLTNLSEDDWNRLEEQRLSPLNVSVHATEPDLRRRMLGNPAAPDVVEQLRRLGTLGIQAHTQIVLCPGVNDGSHLERSVRDLIGLFPTVQSVSVVPVGASPKLEEWSARRDGIELERPTASYAAGVIQLLRPFQAACRKAFGRTVVQCSDEYYLTGGSRLPAARSYDGFRQFENGVGMVRRLMDSWARTRRRLPGSLPIPTPPRLAIGTGTLIAPVVAAIAADAARLTGARIDVHPVANTVFGDRVNVSGLLCGRDYAEQLAGTDADIIVLPRASLDYFGTRLLDDMTVPEIEAVLARPVAFVSRWSEVIDVLRDGPARPSRNRSSNGAMWSQSEQLRGRAQNP